MGADEQPRLAVEVVNSEICIFAGSACFFLILFLLGYRNWALSGRPFACINGASDDAEMV